MQENQFFNKDFISVDQITSLEMVEYLFTLAEWLGNRMEERKLSEFLKGCSIAILFYQESSRTFGSFDNVAKRLGMYTTSIQGMEVFSSASPSKGENLEDTIRSFYEVVGADAIVLRHPDNNSSERAARSSPVPVINAGSGKKEHPTQALLDLLTIKSELGTINDLEVAFLGDLINGRTVKSLAKLLSLVGVNNRLVFVSADELRMEEEVKEAIIEKGATVIETNDMDGALTTADVVYMTRVQKEWFQKEGRMAEYEDLKDKMTLNRDNVKLMKPTAKVMHPLPRQEELRYGVDEDPRAVYFDQMRYGRYVRMALLLSILHANPMSLMD